MRRSIPFSRTQFSVFVVALALMSAFAVLAQSGRRVPKTAPAPVPMPQAKSSPAKVPEKPRPGLTLIVGMDRPENMAAMRATSPGSILLTVTNRLNDNPAVFVDQVRSDMNRGDAVHRAKTEKEAYVVLLEVRLDRTTASNSDNPQLCLQYWVFSPTTAKLKASGTTYPGFSRNRGVILSRRPDIYGDYNLQQAAREAADRILAAFHFQA